MNPEASAVGYRVQNSGRFAHEESYVRHQGQGAGFETCRFQTATLRQQGGKDVRGFLFVMRKTTGGVLF